MEINPQHPQSALHLMAASAGLDYSYSMNDKIPFFKADKVGLALAAAFLVTLTGCVGYVDGPSAGIGVEAPVFVVQDDYVYYPQYECYYSVSRRQYAYREGNRWVARPAPRGVTVNVLQASPSVRMDFHDSPEHHYTAVAKKYPKNWKPSGSNQGRNDNQKGNQRDQRGGDQRGGGQRGGGQHGDNNGR
jgi:hypothetical protein